METTFFIRFIWTTVIIACGTFQDLVGNWFRTGISKTSYILGESFIFSLQIPLSLSFSSFQNFDFLLDITQRRDISLGLRHTLANAWQSRLNWSAHWPNLDESSESSHLSIERMDLRGNVVDHVDGHVRHILLQSVPAFLTVSERHHVQTPPRPEWRKFCRRGDAGSTKNAPPYRIKYHI